MLRCPLEHRQHLPGDSGANECLRFAVACSVTRRSDEPERPPEVRALVFIETQRRPQKVLPSPLSAFRSSTQESM